MTRGADRSVTKSESWDSRYARGKFTASGPNRLLVDLIQQLQPGKALDLACGAGRHSIFLAEHGWSVTAVDSSSVGIEIARGMAREKGLSIDFCLADLEKDEFQIENAAYDLICDFYYLQRGLFEGMKIGVKPGGVVISAIHLFDPLHKGSRYCLKSGELRGFFEDFEILHYRETDPANQGTGEDRRCVAEIIARRMIPDYALA